MEQADDLRAEGADLYAFLQTLTDADWTRPTPFKGWTPEQVVAHLHGTDTAAVSALQDPEGWRARRAERRAAGAGGTAAAAQARPRGRALLERWREYFGQMCDLLAASDPARRVPWVGPDMSARMMATARQMETWAHGQDVYDLLRVVRVNTDRIRNIAVIGVRTFAFTFDNRGEPVPGSVPYVRLAAPSGATWEWNDAAAADRVEGSAVEFCHVVTQGRNIADTRLHVVGEAATRWMAVAQCFAGPPKQPPAPGERAWPGYP